MTRINIIPVEELSDQWLIAEYRELPRVIKQDIDISNAPTYYKLGKGHVKWAKKYQLYTLGRYLKLCKEMRYRGFTVNYPFTMLRDDEWNGYGRDYSPDEADIAINRKRLIEKYKMKPDFYKWTKREKPNWIMKGEKK